MAILSIPDQGVQLNEPSAIQAFLAQHNVFFEQWECAVHFDDSASQETILAAYEKDLQPFMAKGGYQTADVISINSLTTNYDQIRTKFLAEHIHDEDEIRFFVDGQGLFWFHLEDAPVFNVLCQRGDLISVPAGTKHWFDAGPENPFVKAIRIFTDMSGWTPHYTQSGIEDNYKNFKAPHLG
jgi:1,2-dihydroxy-3-keto-5-methylthiopentene dioxygenase